MSATSVQTVFGAYGPTHSSTNATTTAGNAPARAISSTRRSWLRRSRRGGRGRGFRGECGAGDFAGVGWVAVVGAARAVGGGSAAGREVTPAPRLAGSRA